MTAPHPTDILSGWVEQAAEKYGLSIIVITGMEWQDVLSPWPAKGVPDGKTDFKGEAPAFLNLLNGMVIPRIEQQLGFKGKPERALVGASMSGLFSLWQWMLCDTFDNIASLSGSFWYEVFLNWMNSRSIPPKNGRAFFSARQS